LPQLSEGGRIKLFESSIILDRGNEMNKVIIILGCLLIIGSLSTFVSGVNGLFSPTDQIYELYSRLYKVDPIFLNRIISIESLVISPLLLIIAVNILKLKEQWRKILIYYIIFQLFLSLPMLFIARDVKTVMQLYLMITLFNFATIYFLTRPKVKEQFK